MSPFFQWARLYRKKSMSLFWIIIILIKCIAPVFTVAAQRGKKSMKHKAASCGDCSLGQRRTNRMMTNAIRWFIRLFSLFDDFHYKEAGSEASICLWSRSPPRERYFLTLSPPEGESSHCHCHCHCHSSTNQCSWSVHLHRQTRYKHFWMLKRPAGFLLLRKVVIHNTEQNFMHNKPQMRILGKLLRSRGQL